MYPSCKWQNNLQSKQRSAILLDQNILSFIILRTIDQFLKVKQNTHQHLINYLNERLKSWAKNVNEETK